MTAAGSAAFRVRPERDGDAGPIREVLLAAFPESAEADLVDRLRGLDGSRSLVAEAPGEGIVGQILFTPVRLRKTGSDDAPLGVGLAPMSVLPNRQSMGVGTALVRAGLDACRDAGDAAVVVLGHEAYYPRFGFAPASEAGLYFGPIGPHPAFMALELTPGALAGRAGEVRYADEFYEEP